MTDFQAAGSHTMILLAVADPAGRTGTVIGWGRTSEGGMLPNIVHEVDVPILTLSQCRAMKYRASRISTYMVCAGKGTQDSCQGDSGGPLLIHSGDKYEIVGEFFNLLSTKIFQKPQYECVVCREADE